MKDKSKGRDKSKVKDREQNASSVVHEQKVDKILKPKHLPEFAKNALNNIEPSQNLKNDGYRLGDIPTSSHFNWLFNNLCGWDKWLNGVSINYVGVATWNGEDNIYEVELLNDSAPTTDGTLFYDKFFMLSLFFDSENINGGEKIRFNLEGITLDFPLYDRKAQLVQHGDIEEGYITLLYSETDNGFKIMDKTMGQLDSLIKHMGGVDTQIKIMNKTMGQLAPLIKHMGVVDTQLDAVIPTGSIITMSKDVLPSGYLSCEGATISRSTYADLFAIIGETYGAGDGSTTFKLPDFQGMFLRGHGGSGDHQTTDYGVKQEDAGRNVTGAVQFNGGSSTSISSTTGVFNVKGSGFKGGFDNYADGNYFDFDASREWGSSHTADEFRPVNYAVHYCIKY